MALNMGKRSHFNGLEKRSEAETTFRKLQSISPSFLHGLCPDIANTILNIANTILDIANTIRKIANTTS